MTTASTTLTSDTIPQDSDPLAPLRQRRTRRLLLVGIAILIAGFLSTGYWWTSLRPWVETDNAYVTGNLVPVDAQATGIITHVLAEETQFVNKGEVVIRLDEHEAEAALG